MNLCSSSAVLNGAFSSSSKFTMTMRDAGTPSRLRPCANILMIVDLPTRLIPVSTFISGLSRNCASHAIYASLCIVFFMRHTPLQSVLYQIIAGLSLRTFRKIQKLLKLSSVLHRLFPLPSCAKDETRITFVSFRMVHLLLSPAAAGTIPHGAVSGAHASAQLIIRVNFLWS